MTWEIGKEYPLRGGGVGVILEVIHGQEYCLIGKMKDLRTGDWVATDWDNKGRFYGEACLECSLLPPSGTPSNRVQIDNGDAL